MDLPIPVNQHAIGEFCRRHPIKRLSLFGSVLREDFGPDSDVNMLVEFEAGARVGYFKLVEMEMELTEIFGRKVDLRTPAELSRYFRDAVIAEAQVQYAA